METLTDLEEIARNLYRGGDSGHDRGTDIFHELIRLGLSPDLSRALRTEIGYSENLPGLDPGLRELITTRPTGLRAGESGLGSRGEGDFIIHGAIVALTGPPGPRDHAGPSPFTRTPSPLPSTDSRCGTGNVITGLAAKAPGVITPSVQGPGLWVPSTHGPTFMDPPDDGAPVIGPAHRDDGGVVRLPRGTANGEEYLVVSVDGLHSRLGHFPFLAGFHVARACMRDVLVMGARPIALFSDVHLANDGDPAVVLDYTAGITTVGDAMGVPLVAGSTLRIGGDLVTGDRLSGAAGAVGVTGNLTPRGAVEPGDVLVMSGGSGGGTIAAAAIFNGMPSLIRETLNLDFLRFTTGLLDHPVCRQIHALTDVTNGGIRGDLHEIASSTRHDILLYPEVFRSLVNPRVLDMLDTLSIDPLGVSIDALLVACPESVAPEVAGLMNDHGIRGAVVGRVEGGIGEVFVRDPASGKRHELRPAFRESPYTPVKAVADSSGSGSVRVPAELLRERMDTALEYARDKKRAMMALLKGETLVR